MQSVGDQVSTLVTGLERDHLTALMNVDALSSTKDALTSANAVLEKQLADRSTALAAAEKQLADALEMVETVAAAALDMLRKVRTSADVPPIKSPIVATAVSTVIPFAKAPPLIDLAPIAAALAELAPPIAPTFAEQVAGDIMSSDTGDTTPEKPGDADRASLAASIAYGKAINAQPEPPAAPVSEPIAAPAPSAVDRMRRDSPSLLPAPSLSGHQGPMLVVHNEGGLPSFLRANTAFGRVDLE